MLRATNPKNVAAPRKYARSSRPVSVAKMQPQGRFWVPQLQTEVTLDEAAAAYDILSQKGITLKMLESRDREALVLAREAVELVISRRYVGLVRK